MRRAISPPESLSPAWTARSRTSWSPTSSRASSSAEGSRETLAQVLERPQVAWEDGRLVPSRFGATTRRVRFPSGEHTVVEWGGPEPLTIPRHADVRRVRAYARAPRLAASDGKGRFRIWLRSFGSALASADPAPPPEKRRRATFSIVVEATGASRRAPSDAHRARCLRNGRARPRPRGAGRSRRRGPRRGCARPRPRPSSRAHSSRGWPRSSSSSRLWICLWIFDWRQGDRVGSDTCG